MNTDRDSRSHGPDDIAQLIARAGRRPSPEAQIDRTVRAAVEQAWQESNVRRSMRRRTRWFAAAATLVALTGGLLWFGLRQWVEQTPSDATLLAVRGDVTVTVKPKRQLVVAGSHLPTGTTMRTGKSGFVLMSDAAESVRLGPQSRLRIGSGGQVQLSKGRIYVETSGLDQPGPPLIVKTPFGRISHLGTQFQVVVDSAAMAVSVRSGHVRVRESSGSEQRLTAGQGVQVLRGGGVRRMAVRPFGPDWAWANSMLPDLPIDGRPLSEFLAWYTREMGLKLVLLGPGTAAAVQHTVLSGTIAGLTPSQALAAVMATTRLAYDTKVPGELRIRMQRRADRGD